MNINEIKKLFKNILLFVIVILIIMIGELILINSLSGLTDEEKYSVFISKIILANILVCVIYFLSKFSKK
jgi:small-conductance mechanosensitive channel